MKSTLLVFLGIVIGFIVGASAAPTPEPVVDKTAEYNLSLCEQKLGLSAEANGLIGKVLGDLKYYERNPEEIKTIRTRIQEITKETERLNSLKE